eukprot:759578-Hanusia_phi.AAC.6
MQRGEGGSCPRRVMMIGASQNRVRLPPSIATWPLEMKSTQLSLDSPLCTYEWVLGMASQTVMSTWRMVQVTCPRLLRKQFALVSLSTCALRQLTRPFLLSPSPSPTLPSITLPPCLPPPCRRRMSPLAAKVKLERTNQHDRQVSGVRKDCRSRSRGRWDRQENGEAWQ